jgi:hypothetical protein
MYLYVNTLQISATNNQQTNHQQTNNQQKQLTINKSIQRIPADHK